MHDVGALQKSWPSTQIDLLDIGLRTHEILENALQFQVSGHDDYGSGTTLATTEANITGTRVLLTELHPLLAPRYPGLPAVYTWLNRLQKLIDATHTSQGWTAVPTCPPRPGRTSTPRSASRWWNWPRSLTSPNRGDSDA